MLFSPSQRIAFAHYPKTAGITLEQWFRGQFSDAVFADPNNRHYPVAASLHTLRQQTRPHGLHRRISDLRRVSLRVFPGAAAEQPWHETVRIIGVLREPFAMLVSLYEFLRRHDLGPGNWSPTVRCVRQGSFRDMLAIVLSNTHWPPFERFFDVGGPAWHNTRLLDFDSLEPALHEVCTEWGIPTPQRLACLNAAPRPPRNLDRYREEAGPLLGLVQEYYGWYYEQGIKMVIRGRPTALRVAA